MKTFIAPVSPFPFRLKRAGCLPGLVLLAVIAASSAPAATLTRAQAVTALFAPGSGVAIDTNDSAVWSPYVNFGAGGGFEGLLPAASLVNPHELGWLPFPGPGVSLAGAAYFFWVDDLPPALFQHPVRFVLVDAAFVSPTVANGGIRVSAQGWWPRLRLPDTTTQEFFATGEARTSPNPPGLNNPEGLIAGPGQQTSMPAPPAAADFVPAAEAPGNGCGLLLRGDSSAEFGNDVALFESDLLNRYHVASGRIVKANGGNAATKADLVAAITALCALQPPCDKIYVRMTSHGSVGGFCLADGTISAAMLCDQFKKLAAKGVPICLFIEACHSASLFDPHDWDFPAGSVIITSAGSATNDFSYGHAIKFTNAVSGCVTNSLFPHAFSVCLNDPNANPRRNDEQAARWVLQQMPCYTWTGNNKMYYPAGSSNAPAAPNPHPQIRTVGTDPNYLNLNVRNGTGALKTDFHMIFNGDVRGGIARAWRSTPGDQIGAPWAATGATITYDPAKGQTMVCWQDAGAPVAAGDFIHFGYCRAAGGLRPAMQFWTPTATPTAPVDKTPTKEQSFHWNPDRNGGVIRLITSSATNGGEDLLVQGSLGFRLSPVPLPLENLNMADPKVMSLPLQFLGTFVLQPDQPREFLIDLPPLPPATTATLILQTQTFWPLNGNQTTELAQIPLVALLPTAAPLLRYERPSPNLLLLMWNNPGAVLQQAQLVTGPWTDRPEISPVGVPLLPTSAAQFFRLVIPSGP